jgi:HprK-related kinase A
LSGPGLTLDLGAMTVRVKSRVGALAKAIAAVYGTYGLLDPSAFVDSQIELQPSFDFRQPWGSYLRFYADGTDPFGIAPASTSLAQLEWGLNWVYAHLFSRHLLLHAGTVERNNVGMLLVASPGSGKSTLTAALGLSGFRILSDEFGSIRLHDRMLLPLVKPVALKNRSIDLIKSWSSNAKLGPIFRKTHKGDVAHLILPDESVRRRHAAAIPRLILFPTWQADGATELTRVLPGRALSELAQNSFNFGLLGHSAFKAAGDLAENCDCYRLTYSRLDDVVPILSELCDARMRSVAG